MEVVHEVFPLVVYQGSIDCHTELKEYTEEIKKYWFDGYENESPEYSGRILFHAKPEYEIFFDELKRNVDKYLDKLSVDYTKLSYFVSKCWVGYHNKDIPQLNPHTHNESNISFVYYLKSSVKSDKFCVSQRTNINENTGALFETSKQRNTIRGFNKYNCNFYTITPHEGTVLLFPSDVCHHTIKGEDSDERIVLAGDIKVTLRPEHINHHQGCTHPTQWLEL
jgi:uncharacterized protein (TIGR02466 family)